MGSTVSGRVRGWWNSWFGSARYDRLEGALRVAEIEIKRRICERALDDCWSKAAGELLTDARGALGRRQVDQAWKLLHAARRLEILMFDDAERESVAATIRAEADKLKSWRQKAVERLLGSADKPTPNVKAAAIYEAAVIRDEHYDNQAYKDGLLRTQMATLVLSLGIVLCLLGVVITRTQITESDASASVGARFFAAVVLFGLLGATVSAMLNASDTSQSARIPELTSAMRVTFMRILMGGASALVLYVFLASSLGGTLGKQLFSDSIAKAIGTLQPLTAYSVAFVAGFSERLVTRAVEKIAGSASDKYKAKSGT